MLPLVESGHGSAPFQITWAENGTGAILQQPLLSEQRGMLSRSVADGATQAQGLAHSRCSIKQRV